MTAKEFNFLMLVIFQTIAPFSSNAEVPENTGPAVGSQVVGKSGGMGKSYQQNVVGPGQGAPESRGSAAGIGAQPENAAGETAHSGEAEAVGADAPSLELRSRKARDGSGYGAGPGGERGLDSEDAPHHKHYGSPSRGDEQ